MTINQPGDIVALVNSSYAADLFLALVTEFDVFTQLADGKSLAELGIDARAGDVSLTYLTALGLLARQPDGGVALTDAARQYLTAGVDVDLRYYAAAVKDRPGSRDAVRVLRTGEPAPWEGSADNVDWLSRMAGTGFANVFSAAMDARGGYLGPALGAALQNVHPRRLLDIGGSSGIYACSVVKALPETRAAVLDMPSVVGFSRDSIARRGMADRVDVVAGDMFAELPNGFDAHLYSNVFHDWGAGDIERLAAASFAALPPGGVLVDHDMHIDDDKTGPLRQAEFSVRMMLMTTGKCYTTAELAGIFQRVGFGEVTNTPTTAGYSIVVARKPE
jgi:predicted O-methyltransferase YrrM